MHNSSNSEKVVTYKFKSDNGNDNEIEIPIPIPEYIEVDEYVSKVGSLGGLFATETKDLANTLSSMILEETNKYYDSRDDQLINDYLLANNISFKEFYSTKSNDLSPACQPPFSDQFNFIMHNSPCDHLTLLTKKEISMAMEMSHLLRARNWEVEQLTKECENLLGSSETNDMHPHQLSKLNEKLRQVHGSYMCQIEALAEEQRKQYRCMVEAIYQAKGSVVKLPEEVATDFSSITNSSNFSSTNVNESGIDESFTIYIGAQLKSMHNARILTSPDLVSVITHPKIDDIGGRLQMAMSLYGRSLTALILLVPKDPLYHVTMQSDFLKICERSTELHFDSLPLQLKKISESTKEANAWREDNILTALDGDTNPSNSSIRNDTSLAVGDVYITKHSNLRQAQIVFHLVVDEQLHSTEISSRHLCFNGLRNIIRLTSKLGITSVFLPLLLIEKPSETSTVTWCIRRAEMVYKCVKGYLMEVCGSACGGSSAPVPHYNINFIVPSGLSPTIYEQILSMLPSTFHLVPNVTAGTDD